MSILRAGGCGDITAVPLRRGMNRRLTVRWRFEGRQVYRVMERLFVLKRLVRARFSMSAAACRKGERLTETAPICGQKEYVMR